MKFLPLCVFFLFSTNAFAGASCLAFMKDSQGKSAGTFPRQVITKAEQELWSFDDITVTVTPPNEYTNDLAVAIVNDGRKQLMVGQTVWMSGEYLSKSNEAYWILIDCEVTKRNQLKL